jgi:hypothetical protein
MEVVEVEEGNEPAGGMMGIAGVTSGVLGRLESRAGIRHLGSVHVVIRLGGCP